MWCPTMERKSFAVLSDPPGLSVLEFGRDPKKGLEALAYQGKLAVQQDGAECILLGCAGFVDFVEDLSASWAFPCWMG